MKVKCSECGESVEKSDREYKRRRKVMGEDVNFFCNLSCTASFRNKNLTEEQLTRNRHHLLKISKHASNAARRNNYKGRFTYYLKKARSRNRTMNIDNNCLEEIWSRQGGRCAISGIELIINKGRKSDKHLRLASLDRIDSTKGYLKGNVRFIAVPLNYAKNDYDNDEFSEFLIEVARGVLSVNIE